jgi:Ni/Fe-hydrogenase subunit HybB-like protein
VKHIIVRWQRGVPVYALPKITPFFLFLCVMGGLAIVLSAYRESAGLGPTTGMNDIYAWGIWKTFNTMVLTGLGSGGFSIGIAAWIFYRRELHSVMRTAVLTSFVAYFSGLVALGVDVGRPWNFYLVLMPWKWNAHSPLMEVCLCMPLYACFPLLLENTPPLIERWFYTWPAFRPILMKFVVPATRKTYPYVIALAYALPMMHQSSLGALMLLGGSRVHVLWQTPFLPLLYVWAAGFLGYACVIGVLIVACLSWKRPLDLRILGILARIMCWLTLGWNAFRFVDILLRGQIGAAFAFDRFSLLFWLETLLLATPSIYLLRGENRRIPSRLFLADVLIAAGGMLYRFDPTTFAFTARAGAVYFPSPIEVVIAAGFVCLAIAAFILAAKYLPILPAPVSAWHDLEEYARVVHPEWKLETHDFSNHNRPHFAN